MDVNALILQLTAVVASLAGLIPVFLSLAGWAALVTIVINLLKVFGVVQDGQAPKFLLVFNSVGLILFAALGIFAHVAPEQFDALASAIAGLLTAILGFVTMFGVSEKAHKVLSNANLPGIGKSYSGDAMRAEEK